MTPPLMTQAAYAAHQGVTAGAVSKWKMAGHLVWADNPAKPGRKLIDVAASDLALIAERDPTKGRPPSSLPEPAPPLTTPGEQAAPKPLDEISAARLEGLQAQTAQRHLQNEKLAGALVPVAEYKRRAADFGRLSRERVQGVIRQHAERLAAERDPRALTLFLADEVDRVFAQLADEIEEASATPRPAGADTEQETAPATDDPEDLAGSDMV